MTEQNQVDFVDGIELNEIDRLLLNDKSSENDHGFFPFFFAEDHMLREAKQCSGPTLKDVRPYVCLFSIDFSASFGWLMAHNVQYRHFFQMGDLSRMYKNTLMRD